MIKAVIYSRVSSECNRQDTQRQTNELIEYANKMGYELVGVYEEKVSGFKKNEDRPIFSKMLEEIEKGEIQKFSCSFEPIKFESFKYFAKLLHF